MHKPDCENCDKLDECELYAELKELRQKKARDDAGETIVKEALIEAEEKFRSVMEAVVDPIVVYNKDGYVSYFNPAFTRTFGWSLSELLGKRIDFVPEEFVPQTMAAIKAIYESTEGYIDFETKRLTKDGRVLDIMISAAWYRDNNGNPVGTVVNLKDITRRVSSEEE